MKKITKKRTARGTVAALAVIGIILGATAGACGGGSSSGQKKDQQNLSDARKSAQAAVPYPLADLKRGGWLERRLLRENLERENDPNRLAYAVLLNMQGNPVMQWPIKGRIFDLNSQMTTTNITECHNGCSSPVVLEAMGDNGTFGDEPHMVGFFTTSGVEIKVPIGGATTLIESDAPVHFTTKPVITYNENDRPSVDHGGVNNLGR